MRGLRSCQSIADVTSILRTGADLQRSSCLIDSLKFLCLAVRLHWHVVRWRDTCSVACSSRLGNLSFSVPIIGTSFSVGVALVTALHWCNHLILCAHGSLVSIDTVENLLKNVRLVWVDSVSVFNKVLADPRTTSSLWRPTVWAWVNIFWGTRVPTAWHSLS